MVGGFSSLFPDALGGVVRTCFRCFASWCSEASFRLDIRRTSDPKRIWFGFFGASG